MLLEKIVIDRKSVVADIVKEDHHAVDVFRKHGIEYCCGGRFPLEDICAEKGIPFEQIKKELEDACRVVQLPHSMDYHSWNIDFLTNYIVNVHHRYLRRTMPDTHEILGKFASGHEKKFPYISEVAGLYKKLQTAIIPHIHYEEEVVFPYICQVVHAWENNDSYARLLVKTLRKPLNALMSHEEENLASMMLQIRKLAGNYETPPNSCTSHSIALQRLKELDNDLMQHIYLENQVLFPKAIGIEQQLLRSA